MDDKDDMDDMDELDDIDDMDRCISERLEPTRMVDKKLSGYRPSDRLTCAKHEMLSHLKIIDMLFYI